MKVSIIGAALSANKGAAAMLETVIMRLPETAGPCEFTILTTYPDADRSRLPLDVHARVVGLEPVRLALVEFPVAVLVADSRQARLPLGWVRSRGCRAMLDSSVVVDVAVISFVDGRGVAITIYNALMTGVPLLLGVPTVKAAQALGPFNTVPNKWLSRLILTRLAAVCARGAKTRSHLDSLHLGNVHNVADLAFSLDEATALPEGIARQVSMAEKDFIVVMPSAVVRGLFESGGGNYVQAMAEVVKGIRERTGRGVVIAPHSFRVGLPEGRMNDGPVCREVADACSNDSLVVGLDADLTASELRHLVSQGSVLVTSRFHAMISGLATVTPTVVVGWSHKYREVLDDFGLADFGMDSAELSTPSHIVEKVMSALERHDDICAQIHSVLPGVVQKSSLNFSIIAKAAKA
jgi:polysaccharide pyruvyl transferase WcaK-like protein